MTASLGLPNLLESFFHRRMICQRNASSATISSYRDSLRLLVLYAAEQTGREPCQLDIVDLDRDTVLGFLDHLERDRKNSVSTRNLRLTAVRSFFRHVAAADPASLGVSQRVLAIPSKRAGSEALNYLSTGEVDAILAAPNQQTPRGRRDHVLILFMLRTGTRVSEAIRVNAGDLELQNPSQVLVHGKGRKQRRLPLAAEVVAALRSLCDERGLAPQAHQPVFVGSRGHRLTRFGVTHILRRAVATASVDAPSLTRKRVSPHTLRHTLAMRLLQGGSDLVTIQAWLGHAQVATTHRYAQADVEMMRRSLGDSQVTSTAGRYVPKDAVLKILEGLA